MFSLSKIKMNKRINITKDRKQYYKDYYNRNKERLKKQALKYYYENSDDIKNSRRGKQSVYMKLYYQEHKDYFNKRNKTEEVKERQRISSLKHYYNNRNKINEKRKIKYHETKPPPKPKRQKQIKPKQQKQIKPKRQKIIFKPNITDYTFTDDGKVLLRF
jgi:hypothetical protein